MDLLKSILLFAQSVVSKTTAYITGGIVAAGMSIYEHFTGKSVPINVFSWSIAIFFVTACFLSWREQYKENVSLKAQERDALTLPPMQITEIAEYVLNESGWGWKKKLELTLRKYVKDSVAAELRRAGTDYAVRFIGTLPNTLQAVEIDRTYWRAATMDDTRIWDRRNEFFTTTFGARSVYGGVQHYRYGCAPRADVIRTWSRASVFLRIWVTLRIWFRKA